LTAILLHSVAASESSRYTQKLINSRKYGGAYKLKEGKIFIDTQKEFSYYDRILKKILIKVSIALQSWLVTCICLKNIE
jgi:hypothetical protein